MSSSSKKRMLTSSDCRFGTLPDSYVVALPMALESRDETTYTSAYHKNVDARRRITMYIPVSIR